MNWQEYQEAVACFYEQLDGFGEVRRNVYIPDKVTRQKRQIDVLVELKAKGHSLSVVIDAKFHRDPIDVKIIEEIAALADAVGASKAVVVAANGWTEPAKIKAEHLSCDLRILTLEDALDLVVADKWMMCPHCQRDCIVLDQDGMLTMQNGFILWWLAGRCRECKHAIVWCQDCGEQFEIDLEKTVTCYCGHVWSNDSDGISGSFNDGAYPNE
jgi:hypothetical protein